MSYITDPKGAQFSYLQTYNVVDAQTMCGQRFSLEDGTEVVLALNGAVALTAGHLVQHIPIVAADQTLTTTAYTPVSTQTNLPATVTVTAGGTVTANQYALGFAIVKSGTGIGQRLQIASNTAATVSNPIVITLADAPVVALDTTSVINLIAQPYSGIVIAPTTATAGVAGVVVYAIPATTGTIGTTSYVPSYAFIGVKGILAAISDATVAGVGLGIMRSTTTAGTFTVQTATGANIGQAYQTSISADASAIVLNL